MSRILFVAPHPDDESLGCGGSIFKHKAQGDEIFWLIVTSGFEADGFSVESIQQMDGQVEEVAGIYGFDGHERLAFPTTKLDTIPIRDLVGAIDEHINSIKPDTIYVNYKYDVHTDHQVVFDAVWSCTKSFRHSFVKEVYAYETLSETEFMNPIDGTGFRPTVFSDVSPFFTRKQEALMAFKSELAPAPFPRSLESVEALARLRGSTINVQYAEAFMCLKRIF